MGDADDHKDGANPSGNVATNSLLGRQAPRTPMPGAASSQSGPTSHPQWQTPKGVGGGNVSRGNARSDELLLAGQAQAVAPAGMRLNPAFVLWLMGFPEHWLDLPEPTS